MQPTDSLPAMQGIDNLESSSENDPIESNNDLSNTTDPTILAPD
jgi:hypothetical protein